MTSPIEIDGSVLEGGGQILRIAASLSVLTRCPIKVTKIRAGRPKPGLRPQHLKGLEILQKLCKGKLVGAAPNSTEVSLYPHLLEGGEYAVDTETAGSITLLLQVSLPCALFSNCITVLKFRGGTNTDMAPQFDYLTEIFRPVLEKFGASFDYKLVKRGYYPRGGGEVHFRVQPIRYLEPINMLDRGGIEKIWGWSFAAGCLPVKVATSMADAAQNVLRKTFVNIPISIEAYKENSDAAEGNGSGIILVAQTTTRLLLGGSALGKRGVQAEHVGMEAAKQLTEEVSSGGCVDRHCQDQVILFMALAKGVSQVLVGDVTEHTKTAIHICETLTKAKFRIIPADAKTKIIQCSGIGLENESQSI